RRHRAKSKVTSVFSTVLFPSPGPLGSARKMTGPLLGPTSWPGLASSNHCHHHCCVSLAAIVKPRSMSQRLGILASSLVSRDHSRFGRGCPPDLQPWEVGSGSGPVE